MLGDCEFWPVCWLLSQLVILSTFLLGDLFGSQRRLVGLDYVAIKCRMAFKLINQNNLVLWHFAMAILRDSNKLNC